MLGWVADGKFVDEGELSEGAEAAVVLERTNFYGESGGQSGDCGALMGEAGVFDVDDTKIVGQCVLHVGKVRKGVIASGQAVSAVVCGPRRLDIMRNHSATHLLNWALRRVAGEGCDQAGSAVDGDGNVWVSGATESPDWVDGGHDTTLNGDRDAFVVKLATDGSHLWSTYIGGRGPDEGRGIAVDADGNA